MRDEIQELEFGVEVLQMKQSKEYKISIVLFSVSLVLFCISIITGLIPQLNSSIDKICMYLGFSSLCFGFVFLKKSKDGNKDK